MPILFPAARPTKAASLAAAEKPLLPAGRILLAEPQGGRGLIPLIRIPGEVLFLRSRELRAPGYTPVS